MNIPQRQEKNDKKIIHFPDFSHVSKKQNGWKVFKTILGVCIPHIKKKWREKDNFK